MQYIADWAPGEPESVFASLYESLCLAGAEPTVTQPDMGGVEPQYTPQYEFAPNNSQYFRKQVEFPQPRDDIINIELLNYMDSTADTEYNQYIAHVADECTIADNTLFDTSQPYTADDSANYVTPDWLHKLTPRCEPCPDVKDDPIPNLEPQTAFAYIASQIYTDITGHSSDNAPEQLIDMIALSLEQRLDMLGPHGPPIDNLTSFLTHAFERNEPKCARAAATTPAPDPVTVKDMLTSDAVDKWLEAALEERDQLTQVYKCFGSQTVPLSEAKQRQRDRDRLRIVPMKWVWNLKTSDLKKKRGAQEDPFLHYDIAGMSYTDHGNGYLSVNTPDLWDKLRQVLNVREVLGLVGWGIQAVRPGELFSTSLIARRAHTPTTNVVALLLHLVSYLLDHSSDELHIPDDGKQHFTAASDSSFANCPVTFKSWSGYCLMAGGIALSFRSKLQPFVAPSTRDAEVGALVYYVKAIMAALILIHELGLTIDGAPPILLEVDSTAALQNMKSNC